MSCLRHLCLYAIAVSTDILSLRDVKKRPLAGHGSGYKPEPANCWCRDTVARVPACEHKKPPQCVAFIDRYVSATDMPSAPIMPFLPGFLEVFVSPNKAASIG